MRFVVQVRIEHDHPPDTTSCGPEPEIVEVADIERSELSAATIGLSIEEAKQLVVGLRTRINASW